MSKFEDFKEGDTVEHRNCGPGVVTGIVDGRICVQYDKASASGKRWTGEYDHNWFATLPDMLRPL